MHSKIRVPIALDHGISDHTLAVAKTLSGAGNQIIAVHVCRALQGSVAPCLDKADVKTGIAQAQANLAEKTNDIEGVTADLLANHTDWPMIDYASKHAIECIGWGRKNQG